MTSVLHYLAGILTDLSVPMAALSFLGVWLQGQNLRWGWRYSIGIQVLWAVYGVWTDQRGLILMSVGFTALYARNLRRWRHSPTTPLHLPTDLSARIGSLAEQSCRSFDEQVIVLLEQSLEAAA